MSTMIGMLFVTGSLLAHQAESVAVVSYGRRQKNGGMFFNAIICFFAVLYFLVTDKGGIHFPREIFLFGVTSSIMYATGFYAALEAYRLGPFGLTRLISSFGVIISTFYGIVFLREETTYLTYVALVLIVVSLVLMRHPENEKVIGQNLSLKWLTFLLLNVGANALITILNRTQHEIFGDVYKNEFLIISFAGAAIWLLILGVLLERETFNKTIKYGVFYGATAGLFNGITNILNLKSYTYLPLSTVVPVRTGLGMVMSFMISLILYKEKFTRRQIVSVIIGIFAVILINLKV